MANTEYITIQGDRWDSIAYKAYGDATLFTAIQDANPNVPLRDTFQGGVRLIVPILEDAKNDNNNELLPPWKRTPVDQKVNVQEGVSLLDSVQSDAMSFDSSYDKSFN